MSEPNLFEFLSGDADVATLVGERVYLQMIPQHVWTDPPKMPCAVYSRVGAQRQPMLCATDSLVQATYQVDSYAIKPEDVVALARAIRRALVDYCGPMGDAVVKAVRLETDADIGPDPTPGLFRRMQQFTVWYVED